MGGGGEDANWRWSELVSGAPETSWPGWRFAKFSWGIGGIELRPVGLRPVGLSIGGEEGEVAL
jgi:hypothetical protein